MVAQHYDNIWVYHKEITKKYDNDNRLEYGVSKDIVADAIRDFGVKLYQNNFSNNDLYTAFLGLTPQGGLFPFPNITGSLPTPSGFEYIDQFISASNDFTPLDDVNKSLYKRIYHNLPYLLKSKGTLPGLRALITSYGIPDTILRINEFGGKDKVDSNDWDYWQNEFNYAFYTEGTNYISSSFILNSNWDSPNNKPSTIEFRFKAEEFPPTNLSQSLLSLNGGELTLQYTGSGLTSSSYSGSTIDPYYQYANLTFYPSSSNLTLSSSLYLPFFNQGWWSVMLTSGSNGFELHAGDKIYEGGDNNTILGFYSSSSIISSYNCWDSANIIYFSTGSLFNNFSGSLQEIRYFKSPLSESVFKDYIMNPHSIEGNTINSSPDELIFRASLGGELYTGSNSIHPKVTGSWVTTQSFTSDSNFYYDQTPIFTPNTEYFFYDQPIAGIRNSISDKIRIENNVMPEGDTLSPFMSLSQMSNVSQSYTQNINYLEVAFSPQNEINEDIMSQIGSFNIGELIGDPRLRSSSAVTYPALDQLRNEYFQKYISNYNLTDFIRLIKFFDNSLFKMIRDFVPARTSLASGIVIKQHLLERNKYPQPQIELENLDISGTLKPTWNNYEPGTVENFGGQTGGVFDQFNLISNTSQSWYENITTPSGSVLMLHDSQDEFYNGEFSGSVILVTDGILNTPYPLDIQAFNYTPVRYSTLGYNISSESQFAQIQFLNSLTIPNQGEILLLRPWRDTSVIPQLVGPTYAKIHKIDNNGVDNSIALGQVTQLQIKYSTLTPYYTLQVLSINEHSTYYLYQLNTLGNNTADNYILDYKISGSVSSSLNISNGMFGRVTLNTSLYNPNNFYNTSNGIYSVNNVPNTKLTFKLSGTASAITSTAEMNLFLISTGSNIGLTPQTIDNSLSYFINPGSPITFEWSGSYDTFSPWPDLFTTEYIDQLGPEKSLYFEILNNNDFYTGNLQITGLTLNINQYLSPSADENDPIILIPYITTPNFYNSDGNALLNNAFELRDSSYYMDVDYSSGLTEPVNFGQLISGSATRAKVQDSNYTSKRVTIPRYEGSKSTSRQLNKWTRGDIGTFGKLPTVENLKSYVAYGYMDGSWAPERMNASAFTIKYLIDQDGNISTPNISDISLSNTQQNFPSRDRFRYSSLLGLSGTQGGTKNQFRNIIRGGYRIEPILYNQSGSAPGAQWNTTMSFQDIVPSNTGVTQNYAALFGKTTTDNITTPNTEILIQFNTAVYGDSFLSPFPDNGYQVPLSAIQDGVNLTFNVELVVLGTENNGGVDDSLLDFATEILLYKNSTLIASTLGTVPSDGKIYFEYTVNSSELQENDIYKIFAKYYNSTIQISGAPYQTNITNFEILPESQFKISQYPLFTQPVTSSGINSIWGYADSGSYPYIITSSNQTLVELYDSNVKQTDITGSGFNPITLPWSIQYGDEFRFEGREDFTYVVGKIFSSADSGSGRIFQTGSIEVHFDRNLPVSASSSAFNLDHFLIRRYVDDPSQIIFEGFRPTNGASPNSFILTPEYVIPKLNKNTDEFVKLLTEKGLIG
jgi:hypothetical protein